MLALALWCGAALLTQCSEGDFDQRLRAEIDELRVGATEGPFNNNPVTGAAKIRLTASTGGTVSLARAEAFPIGPDGTILTAEADVLGNSGTLANGFLLLTLNRVHRGAVVVRLRGGVTDGLQARFANPALVESDPTPAMGAGDELLGFVVDVPEISDGVVISPLTTLAVELADFLGGPSSGNLGYAARKVGAFFEVFDVRRLLPDNMIATNFRIEALREDFAVLTIAAYARSINASPLAVLSAMRLDIRDDGELNGSGPLVPGTGVPLPAFGAANFMGTTLRNVHFAPGNLENSFGIFRNNVPVGSSADIVLNELDQAHQLTGGLLTLDEFVVQFPTLTLAPGASAWPGIRGFERQGSTLTLVHGSEGPWLAEVSITSNNPNVAAADSFGRIVANPSAQSGDRATLSVRITTDGDAFVTGVDQTFMLEVVIS